MALGSKPDRITVLAIAALVFTLAKVTHEGIGHGLTCLAVGGTLKGVSSSWCDCDTAGVSAWAGRAVSATGTLANLALGAAFLIVLRRMKSGSGALAYFLWLSFAVNSGLQLQILATVPPISVPSMNR